MTEQELIKRIEGMNIDLFLDMSYKSMAVLTDKYNESLVKRVVARGKTKKDQEYLLDEIRKSYEYNLTTLELPYSNEKVQLFFSIQFDLECGILITNEGKPPIDEKNSEPTTELEQRIKELEAENEQLREHLAQWQKNEDEEETTKLKVEINRLNNDLEAFRTQDGKKRMTASQAAIFIQTACHHLGGLPNDKKTLSPILQWGWGFTEHTSRRALGGEAQPIVAEKTAQLFDNISPKMARLIREFPKTFDKLRKEKLKANNDKKLNDIKEKPR